jgi:murein L,D-transpeptidase YafK
LWARPAGGQRFVLLKAYPICALAGEIGPKRREGDNQTPEGFYEIDAFNPNSEYLLSLHISYPNASDRALGRRAALGGAIYLHGGCRTVGCIAVTDDAIEELYWIAVEARAAGQLRVPVHIFPAHLTDEEMARLAGAFRGRTELLAFWENLRPGYEHFERLRVPPAVTIDSNGRYMFSTAVRVRRGDAALPAGR